MERVRYLGRGVACPLCGGRFRAFAPDRWDGSRWFGQPVRCPNCGSLPRHRALWLHLEPLLGHGVRVLHAAPEPALAARISASAFEYTSVDLEPGRAAVQADLTALPFGDSSFDLAIASHVLEHVPDDLAALREIERVLATGGAALIQTPVNYDQTHTFEDAEVSDPAERLRLFSQADHVRVYGRDLAERLASVGFAVTIHDASELGEQAVKRYVLAHDAGALRNDLYVCRVS